MTVSLVRFDGSLDSLRRAIELCDGFAKLRSGDRVLIKPNNSLFFHNGALSKAAGAYPCPRCH
jgi:uncharacterized protein (DUF362 family)